MSHTIGLIGPTRRSWLAAVVDVVMGGRTQHHEDAAELESFPVAEPGVTTGPAGEPESEVEPGQCVADWRRPDEYWRCVRPAGHSGRHRMRRADHPEV